MKEDKNMAKLTNGTNMVTIEPINLVSIPLRIIGDSPLIVHAWGHKAQQEMLDKQTKKTKATGKEAKNPTMDFIESLYWMEGKPTEFTNEAFNEAVHNGARWGFPVTAIKKGACVVSSRNELGIQGTKIKSAFIIDGVGPNQLAEIKGSIPEPRQDMVRIGGISKTADIRFRAQFNTPWYMDLTIRYNQNGALTLEQIITLINMAGFSCGIGEWRPEKDGVYGQYHVELGQTVVGG